ncbi:MAG TPA: lysylphosphatidylglycerol synthase transmembrane domain-containing protein [Dehalococcoidia bacterium]|nr:lysylphosphatidylglycerol synthase transmembrane domain-containing protein [Dehalococcoidia bacterium]
MLRSRRLWIGVIISIAFLALFFYRVDFMAMGRALAEANYVYLLPALAVYFTGVYFRAIRWQYLLRPLGSFSSLYLFRLIVIGFTLNNIVPGRLGIFLRAYILGEKKKISKVAVGATVGVERIFDGLALVLFLVVISFFVSLPEGAELTGWVEVIRWVSMGIFLFCLLGLVFITFRPDTTRKMGMVLIRRLPSKANLKWDEWLDAAIIGLKVPRQPGRLFAVSATSLLVWLCEGSMFYLLSLGFDLEQPFHVMLLVMCIATLSWFILVAPGGVGTFDWFGRETLVVFGVSMAAASAAILLIHAALLLPVIALGFLFLWMENISMAQVIGGGKGLAEKCEPG